MKIPGAQLPGKENVTKVRKGRWAGRGGRGGKGARPSLERYTTATPLSKRKVGRTGVCNPRAPVLSSLAWEGSMSSPLW